MRLGHLLVLIFVVAIATPAIGAGTLTNGNGKALTENDWESIGNGVWRLVIIATDDATGIDADIPVPESLYGAWPTKALVDPGIPAPTGDLDIQLTWHGKDIFDDALLNCDLTNNTDADYAIYAPMDDDLGIVVENNTHDGAVVTIIIYAVKG